MIHHISIAARNPEHVANVLAEIWQGYALPFPPFPGAYIVMQNDAHGTAIEIAPLGLELTPGTDENQVQPSFNENGSPFTATHVAVSVQTSEERIKEIAAREGWRAVTLNRDDAFSVVELWIENRLLIELLPPEMAKQYLDFATPEKFAEAFGLNLAA